MPTKQQARENLAAVLRRVVDALPQAIPGMKARPPQRDKREPHHTEKDRFERRLMDVFMRRFVQQKRLCATRLPVMLPAYKTIIDPRFIIDDNTDDGYEQEEVMRIILAAAKDGINLFDEQVVVNIDWSKVNTRAAEWAKQYVGELIKNIDQTTLDAVRQAINTFINTPGMTMGDIVEMLPFDEVRAWRIAITETTRAYAEGQKLAGDQLRAEFPDVRVVKMWFTNNDDLVCDICAPMDGEEVDTMDMFSSGDDKPPAHVNCRCWTDYRTDILAS